MASADATIFVKLDPKMQEALDECIAKMDLIIGTLNDLQKRVEALERAPADRAASAAAVREAFKDSAPLIAAALRRRPR